MNTEFECVECKHKFNADINNFVNCPSCGSDNVKPASKSNLKYVVFTAIFIVAAVAGFTNAATIENTYTDATVVGASTAGTVQVAGIVGYIKGDLVVNGGLQNTYTGTMYTITGGTVTYQSGSMTVDLVAADPSGNEYKFTGTFVDPFQQVRDYSANATQLGRVSLITE